MYTTPSDVDFYLTNVAVSAVSTENPGATSITFTTSEGDVQIFGVVTVGAGGVNHSSSNLSMEFPMQGIKLARSSAITFTLFETGYGHIAGYRASGRS